jgi:pimeloyl-ACP methyl ester carboxylesterase
MQLKALASLVLGATLLSGCSGAGGDASVGAAGAAPALQHDLTGFTGQTIPWRGCGNGESFQAGEAKPHEPQCAYLRVPTDYAKPDAGEQQLAAMRLPATGAKRAGVLFVNPGGPGEPATAFARPFAEDLPKSIRAAFDVVVLDPRGVGESGAVSCLDVASAEDMGVLDTIPDTEQERQALRKNLRQVGKSCAQRQPSLIGHLATEDFARDVDLLRDALNVPKLSLLGYSYGSLLGYHYARFFPQHVEHLVLDGAVEPGVAPAEQALEQARTAQNALWEAAGECVDHDCDLGDSAEDVLARIVALQEKLDAEPVELESHEGLPAIDDAVLTETLLESLYVPGYGSELVDALDALRDGDPGPFLVVYDELAGDGPFLDTRVVNGVAVATECLDEPRAGVSEADRKRIEQASAVFGKMLASDAVVCQDWPVPPRDAPATRLPKKVSALVLSNDPDPATPEAAADRLTALMPGAVHFRTGLFGHTAAFQGDECVDSAVTRYLLAGDTRPAERGCSDWE